MKDMNRLVIVLLTLTACGKEAARHPAEEANLPQRTFASPEEAATALIQAAEKFDQPALVQILGGDGRSLVMSKDTVQDRQRAITFGKEAQEQHRVELDSTRKSAILAVGPTGWPLPIPIVQDGSSWRFDSKAGANEILIRRVGENELDAIKVCRGYVEAQRQYASARHDGSPVNQYAQRIISTPGKHDGLAWQAPDGSWQGPVGEAIAKVIGEGYRDRYEPFHGYYFKVLKGQGPSAPNGAMNFMVDSMMIGGFALVAAPADYRVTGVQTFIVSYDGVVYQQDLGPETLDVFKKMELYDPDSTWTAVPPDEPPSTQARIPSPQSHVALLPDSSGPVP
jgi:Protein of unknown function (DUF2950)